MSDIAEQQIREAERALSFEDTINALPTAVRQINDVADFYVRKAQRLREIATDLRENGTRISHHGFVGIAKSYTDEVTHCSLGSVAFVSQTLADCTAQAAILDTLKPERHKANRQVQS